jgi:glutamate carboxypeptidase
MHNHQPILDWIASEQDRMLSELIDWCNINTGTGNVTGTDSLLERVLDYAGPVSETFEYLESPPAKKVDRTGNLIEVPLGRPLSLAKHREGTRRVLLCIHSDTVYPPDHPFQKAALAPDGTLRGPGAADAKGGLIVMLTALQAFEQCPFAENISWDVLVNSDEEIGSPSSASALEELAKQNDIGLLFEPALSDGGLADRRKGSGNFTIVIRGRSAHAGRDFEVGRSAVLAAAELIVGLHDLNKSLPGAIVNVGAIEGGGSPNVVPDLAICRVNVRTSEPEDEARLTAAMNHLVEQTNHREGINAKLIGGFHSPPKIPTPAGIALLKATVWCGKELGLNLTTRPVGGSCDGNRLAAAGLPNVDTLGVRGGKIHSPEEFMIPASLTERAQLTALLLMKLAAGEIPWP